MATKPRDEFSVRNRRISPEPSRGDKIILKNGTIGVVTTNVCSNPDFPGIDLYMLRTGFGEEECEWIERNQVDEIMISSTVMDELMFGETQ